MAKFYGKVAFSWTEDAGHGVFEEKSCERLYYGDVPRNIRRWEDAQRINGDLSLNNTISIVLDGFLDIHAGNIRYVEYAGAKWLVTNIEFQRPRILLTLGGVYRDESLCC